MNTLLKALRERITTEYKYILSTPPNDLQLNDELDLLDIIDAQAQRIADLETFYDYEEDSGSVLKQMNEFWMLAKNHDSWKEHAEWFEALVKRCHHD